MFWATLLASMALSAQPAFDLASVRAIPNERNANPSPFAEKIDVHHGIVIMTNVRIRTVVKWAYDLHNYEISGVDMLAAEHYNINAKSEEDTPIAQLRLMMRALLATRFKLQFRREAKELRGYDLLVKDESKLPPAQGDGEADIGGDGPIGYFKRTSMAELADFLSFPLEAPVFDKTGLNGRFDFELHPAANMTPGLDPVEAFKGAVENQLGLKFQPRKATVDLSIIAHAEKVPTEN
jgi:uncharacterized protein (TIGR03435 family)